MTKTKCGLITSQGVKVILDEHIPLHATLVEKYNAKSFKISLDTSPTDEKTYFDAGSRSKFADTSDTFPASISTMAMRRCHCSMVRTKVQAMEKFAIGSAGHS